MGDFFLIKTIFIFLVGLIVTILINRLFLKFSKNLGIRNIDDQVIRWKTTSKPAFGGITFFIVFLLILSLYPILFSEYGRSFDLKLIGIVAATTLGFLAGLTDDAYNTNPILKSIAQAICAIILIGTGTCIDLFDSQWLNYSITFFWVVGMMNSINMLDNMDAVTTMASIFALVSMLLVMYFLKNFGSVYFVLVIGLIAALFGFLMFNWYPSKMYMGDTGSQFLGVILSALSIQLLWNYSNSDVVHTSRQILFPLLAFIIPISDTTTVVINRISKGNSPFVGGRDHTTHHLIYFGLTEPLVAFVIGCIGLISALLLLIALSIKNWNHLFTILYSIYGLVVFLSLFLITKKTTPVINEESENAIQDHL